MSVGYRIISENSINWLPIWIYYRHIVTIIYMHQCDRFPAVHESLLCGVYILWPAVCCLFVYISSVCDRRHDARSSANETINSIIFGIFTGY